MSYNLTIPQNNGVPLAITVSMGECLFILGANGTGKSSLMQKIYSLYKDDAQRITAHRQTWFSSGEINVSPEQKRSTENAIRNQDTHQNSRWMEFYSEQRPSIAIYNLIEAQNSRARTIAEAADCGDIELVKTLAKPDAPIKMINELLRLSNMNIEISIVKGEQVRAKKSSSAPYSIAELSDGERNFLLIASTVLTAKSGSLLLIDEPERHLHRSIISSLLNLLFAKRVDCAFIVSTHEVMLPIDNPGASTLLIRGCTYSNSLATTWDADLVPPGSEIDDDIQKDILGARRKLLFIEGTEKSLDKPLYGLIFPNVSVIAKSSCRDVEHAVSGIRDSSSLHWVQAFGIIDNDRRTQEEVNELKARGIYATAVFSVESIYYHPEIQLRVSKRHAAITGEDPLILVANAKSAAVAAVIPHIQRLSGRAVEKSLRREIFQHLPKGRDIATSKPINISIDVASAVSAERTRFQNAIDVSDLSMIMTQYPIRETPCLLAIANKLGFQSREQYEKAVRKLMIDDSEALIFARSLFGTLEVDINEA